MVRALPWPLLKLIEVLLPRVWSALRRSRTVGLVVGLGESVAPLKTRVLLPLKAVSVLP